jgi:hypothetical protein
MRILAAFIAILAAAVIAMAAFGQFAPAPSPVVRSTSRPPSTGSASPTPSGPRTITVTLTEQELTTAAQSYTPLTVSGKIVVVASPLVTSGKAAAKIESATFAGIALPDSTKQDVADTFARVLAANIPSGVRVTSLTVNAGALVIETVPA